ncbi:Hemerythrin-like domain-containing protein [Shewanella morhuae]|uniref:hemerythrin domain-containing protein n=1 Tax=Shewanella morhuae TaxID=365591 RepID=UPI000954D2D3|nr:hemerythrin domain-containing protein [Shewanella morhuae]SIQ61162.1 Hemerythrin-like domain-containing protein [Shewanella morhuae]
MLKRLMNDHKHIAVLLNVLKNKQMKLSEGESINFTLVRDIVEYMQGYAERYHHPTEDIIYAYYLTHKANGSVDKLSADHERVGQASSALMATLNLILSDIVVAREKLIIDFAEYVALQKQHMEMEGREVFPLLSSGLTDQDWQLIELECQKAHIDAPFFQKQEQQEFESLRAYFTTSD